MKWITFSCIPLWILGFKCSAQSDFIETYRVKICDQIQSNDVKLLLADSLYRIKFDSATNLEKAYLNLWKAQGHFYSSEQSLDSVADYAVLADTGFEASKDSLGRFESKRILGKVQHYNNNFTFSRRYLNQARELAKTEIQRFKILLDFGDFFIHKDEIDSTLVSLNEAKKILPLLNKEHCEYSFLVSEFNISLGMAEIRKTDYENVDYTRAIKYFKRAIKSGSFSVHKSTENYLFCLVNLAYCYRKGGFFGLKSIHLDSARYYTEKYINLVKKVKVSSRFEKLETAYENLAWLQHTEGSPEVGMYNIQKAMDYKDSVYNELLNNKVLQITNSYENKLKNQRIEKLHSENDQIRKNYLLTQVILILAFLLVGILLFFYYRFRQKNRLLKEQKQEITEIKEQLEVLLREIHHRIKNNLQVISSFLGIQKRNPNTLDTEVILSQCQDRIQTISLMHEQLYSQKEFEYIAIKFYLKKIINNHIDTSFESQNIDVIDKIENHSIDFERGLSLGIILNELLVNAAKYAFVVKRKGSISIVFKKKPSGFLFEVSDNGIGFPDNFAEENSNQSGIGYQIIWAMVNKLNGAMDFKSHKGAIISISFPY